jgi:transcription termination factor NusB
MWTKDFTICLCIAVYQKLTLENWPELSHLVDWSLIFEELKVSVDKSELAALDSQLDYIWCNHNQFEQILSKFLNQPKKTHPFVRAVLLVFLAELLHLNNKSTSETTDQPPNWLALVKKYVRITQNYIGAENPSLVYAVASKLLQENHNQSASE